MTSRVAERNAVTVREDEAEPGGFAFIDLGRKITRKPLRLSFRRHDADPRHLGHRGWQPEIAWLEPNLVDQSGPTTVVRIGPAVVDVIGELVPIEIVPEGEPSLGIVNWPYLTPWLGEPRVADKEEASAIRVSQDGPGFAWIDLGRKVQSKALQLRFGRLDDEASPFLGQDGRWQAQIAWIKPDRIDQSGASTRVRVGPTVVDSIPEGVRVEIVAEGEPSLGKVTWPPLLRSPPPPPRPVVDWAAWVRRGLVGLGLLLLAAGAGAAWYFGDRALVIRRERQEEDEAFRRATAGCDDLSRAGDYHNRYPNGRHKGAVDAFVADCRENEAYRRATAGCGELSAAAEYGRRYPDGRHKDAVDAFVAECRAYGHATANCGDPTGAEEYTNRYPNGPHKDAVVAFLAGCRQRERETMAEIDGLEGSGAPASALEVVGIRAIQGGFGRPAFRAFDLIAAGAHEEAAWHLARFFDPRVTDPVYRGVAAPNLGRALYYYALWKDRSARHAQELRSLCQAYADEVRRDPQFRSRCGM